MLELRLLDNQNFATRRRATFSEVNRDTWSVNKPEPKCAEVRLTSGQEHLPARSQVKTSSARRVRLIFLTGRILSLRWRC